MKKLHVLKSKSGFTALLCAMIITAALAGVGCGGGGGGGGDSASATTSTTTPAEGGEVGETGISSEDISRANVAFVNGISDVTTDNGSDYSNPYHIYMKLINSDGNVKIEYDFVSDCSSVPLGGNGSYNFNNYLDPNGVTVNGNLSFYIVYNGDVNNFSYVFTGNLTFGGVINYSMEYNYMFNCSSGVNSYTGYCKIDNLYYIFNTNGTLSTSPQSSQPIFDPPARVTSSGCEGVAPATPSGLTANVPTKNSLNISWNAVTGATNYWLYYATTSTGTYNQIGGDITDTNYIHTGLMANTNYYYKILARNDYGSSGLSDYIMATTSADGCLDMEFDPGSGVDEAVYSLAVQADGRIILGGFFWTYNGVGYRKVVRINSDGSIDSTFNIGTGFDASVNSVIIQVDGKILLGGEFTSYNGTTANRIIRLNADGSIDTSFNSGSGFDGSVYDIRVQSDGKMVIGGSFGTYNGTSNLNIVRINTDGSIDASFNPGARGLNAGIRKIGILSNGKIVFVSNSSSNGYTNYRVYCLNSDGSVDTSFHSCQGTQYYNYAYTLNVMPNDKILIGGDITSYDGFSQNGIIRINSDGTRDTTFNSGEGVNNANIYAIRVQNDGKIIIGGSFNIYTGIARRGIARINSDGTLDTTFDPGSGANNGYVYSLLLLNNGKIIIGGTFRDYNGIARNRIAQILNN